jgi:hypothetical protein
MNKKEFDKVGEVISKKDIIIFIGFGKCKAVILKARDIKSSRGTMVYIPEKTGKIFNRLLCH